MPLEQYNRKRDFARTPEPAPTTPAVGAGTLASRGGRFVVQRHRATRLHYDFRLEIDGVLVSWAVPRGPTLDSTQRRMAIHVEDHPIEYLDFEGVIPARQYGAGDVIVWDWGTWEPEAETPDPAAAIAKGELKFRLNGEKLRGRFTIVRTSGRDTGTRPFESDEKEQWLLIHKRDDAAVEGWDAEEHPASVKTGRTNDEVKADRDAYWISQAPTADAEIDLSAAEPAEGPPTFIEPMLATLADRPFDDPAWLFEIKWDGYRVQSIVYEGKVRIYTRNGHDAATYFPHLLPPPARWLMAEEAIIDGEVVALDPAGRPDFSLLQARISQSTGGRVPGLYGRGGRTPEGGSAESAAEDTDAAVAPLVYQVFDLLRHDGRSLLKVPLEDRKRLLRAIVKDGTSARFAAHVVGEGMAFYRAAAAQHLEGIVAKNRRSRYEPSRRTTAWLKIKLRPEQALVVGGWTPGEGNAKELGAIVVGVMEDGRLRFAGKVGSGFHARARRQLRERLDALATDHPPFDPLPGPRSDLRGVHWVEPKLVIRAELGGWSRDGLVRQSAFKGIDDGRDPLTVIRESPVASPVAEAEVDQTLARDPGGHPPGENSGETNREAEAEVGMVRTRSGSSAKSGSSGKAQAGATAESNPSAKATSSTKSSSSEKAKANAGATSAQSRPEWAPATPAELEALERLGKGGSWTVGGIELKLTNLDKVLFPPAAATPDDRPVVKRELIAYFAQIAPAMLPHLEDRPLNLQRFPDGAMAPGFWQKDLRQTDPAWLRRWREPGVEARAANTHLVADRTATLCWLGNQAAFEIHAWTSRLTAPDRPTFALIDIDPGERTTWDETLVLARLFRTALGHLGVRGYPKLTGKRGIQVWIPIEPHYGYDETSAWVEGVSRAVAATVPELVSWEWSKDRRGGKARLDYTQNTYIKTLVAPYAVRPAPGAPVSAPISWDELDDPSLTAQRWTIRTMPDRVAAVGDLFAPAQTDLQSLPEL
jgi:DNA ligase D-like protein (predicted ligase)/DNA ligase D-like protein (predicted polymerase)/DNA ligase D-like protein (predicted 3'-phosphoesterase)